jgi:glucokinase
MPELFSVGLDLGGTNIVAVAYSSKRGVLVHSKVATLAREGAAGVLQRLADQARKVQALAGLQPAQVSAIGLGSPGPLDAKRGIILDAPNIAGLRGYPIVKKLAAKTRHKVLLENDANAAAVAEHRLGAGRGCQDMLLLTLGTGVGGGLILGGKLFTGVDGCAGELGYLLLSPSGPVAPNGSQGTLECYASANAIARRARELMLKDKKSVLWALAEGDPKKVSSKLVHQAFKRRDKVALQVWKETAMWLGRGLGSYINIFNPQRIVLGGGVMLGGDELLVMAGKVAKSLAFQRPAKTCRIVKAQLGDDAGAIGAAEIALDSVRAGKG